MLITMLFESSVNELETRTFGYKIRIVKNCPENQPRYYALPSRQLVEPLLTVKPINYDGKECIEIKSPFVGTFRRSSAPNVPPYVRIKQMVTAGQTICAVETMKLPNEVKMEFDGTIFAVLLEDGAPVQFGQPMFLVTKQSSSA